MNQSTRAQNQSIGQFERFMSSLPIDRHLTDNEISMAFHHIISIAPSLTEEDKSILNKDFYITENKIHGWCISKANDSKNFICKDNITKINSVDLNTTRKYSNIIYPFAKSLYKYLQAKQNIDYPLPASKIKQHVVKNIPNANSRKPIQKQPQKLLPKLETKKPESPISKHINNETHLPPIAPLPAVFEVPTHRKAALQEWKEKLEKGRKMK